jgi:hypothetical protein
MILTRCILDRGAVPRSSTIRILKNGLSLDKLD